jgi:hypothetical protein
MRFCSPVRSLHIFLAHAQTTLSGTFHECTEAHFQNLHLVVLLKSFPRSQAEHLLPYDPLDVFMFLVDRQPEAALWESVCGDRDLPAGAHGLELLIGKAAPEQNGMQSILPNVPCIAADIAFALPNLLDKEGNEWVVVWHWLFPFFSTFISFTRVRIFSRVIDLPLLLWSGEMAEPTSYEEVPGITIFQPGRA